MVTELFYLNPKERDFLGKKYLWWTPDQTYHKPVQVLYHLNPAEH